MVKGNLKPVNGLMSFVKWVAAQGYRTAAVTNAPREVLVGWGTSLLHACQHDVMI